MLQPFCRSKKRHRIRIGKRFNHARHYEEGAKTEWRGYIQRSCAKTCLSWVIVCPFVLLSFWTCKLGFIAKFDITKQRTRAMSSASWSRRTRCTCLTSGPPRGKTEMETAYKHEGGKVTASGIGESIGILRLAHQLLRTHYYQTSQHFTALLDTTGSERAKLGNQIIISGSCAHKHSPEEAHKCKMEPSNCPFHFLWKSLKIKC